MINTKVSGNKAKSRRAAADKARGKYTKQAIRTAANKLRRKKKLLSLE